MPGLAVRGLFITQFTNVDVNEFPNSGSAEAPALAKLNKVVEKEGGAKGGIIKESEKWRDSRCRVPT